VTDDPFAPTPQVLSGETAGVYFLRTRQVMEAAGLNPIAVNGFGLRRRKPAAHFP